MLKSSGAACFRVPMTAPSDNAIASTSGGGVPVGCRNHAGFTGRLAVDVLRLGIISEPEQDRTEAGKRSLRDVAGFDGRGS
jgi:hypothetical protein